MKWGLFLIKYRLPFGLRRSSNWSLDISDYEVILKYLKDKSKSGKINLLELGSGISTIIFASYLLRLSPRSKIYSIEGTKEFARQMFISVEKYRLGQNVRLYYVPYKRYQDGLWFDKEKIRKILDGLKIDVVIVDAPPGAIYPYARQPAVPLLLDYLKKKSMVILHDAKRPGEKKIIEGWSKYFNETKIIDTPRGIAFFR